MYLGPGSGNQATSIRMEVGGLGSGPGLVVGAAHLPGDPPETYQGGDRTSESYDSRWGPLPVLRQAPARSLVCLGSLSPKIPGNVPPYRWGRERDGDGALLRNRKEHELNFRSHDLVGVLMIWSLNGKAMNLRRQDQVGAPIAPSGRIGAG